MQTTLLKEYVSKAKDLELSCYEQKLLCDDLEQTLVNVDYQRKIKKIKKEIEEYLEKALQKAKQSGVSHKEVKELLELLMEE